MLINEYMDIFASFILSICFLYRITKIYEYYGRVRIFHGINRVEKNVINNYYFKEMLNNSESLKLNKLGFNVVRLGWMWDGFEHNQNEFNMTYFNEMQTIVNNLGKYNIYTILDMHQDVLSSRFCSYDGIPLWVANKAFLNKISLAFKTKPL